MARVNTQRYIFSGMNIHLPAILGFTRYQGFDPSPNNQMVASPKVHGKFGTLWWLCSRLLGDLAPRVDGNEFDLPLAAYGDGFKPVSLMMFNGSRPFRKWLIDPVYTLW